MTGQRYNRCFGFLYTNLVYSIHLKRYGVASLTSSVHSARNKKREKDFSNVSLWAGYTLLASFVQIIFFNQGLFFFWHWEGNGLHPLPHQILFYFLLWKFYSSRVNNLKENERNKIWIKQNKDGNEKSASFRGYWQTRCIIIFLSIDRNVAVKRGRGYTRVWNWTEIQGAWFVFTL